jgi:hypothetical protein
VHLRVGDAVDFWRVEALDPNHLLRLRAEMRLPGRAWLQFAVTPTDGEPNRSRITQTVFFEPKGLAGTVYWNLVRPLHGLFFRGLLRQLASWIKERAPAETAFTEDHPPLPELQEE